MAMSRIMGVKKRWMLVVVVGLFAAAAFFLLSRPIQVQSAVVKRTTVYDTVLASGRVASGELVEVSAAVAGTLESRNSSEGEHVERGAVLLSLDRTPYKKLLEAQESSVNAADAALQKLRQSDIPTAAEAYNQAKAQGEYDSVMAARQKSLYESGGISQSDYEAAALKAQQSLSQARATAGQLAALRGSQYRLALAQQQQASKLAEKASFDYTQTVIRAPFAGSVVKYEVNSGEYVAIGKPVLLFMPEGAQKRIEVSADEAEIGKIRLGQKAYVDAGTGSDVRYNARVARIGRIVDMQSGTFAVVLEVQGDVAGLVPDMTVSAQIITQVIPDALAIDKSYVSAQTNGSYVYLLQKGRAALHRIVIRDLGNGTVIVQKGLTPGDIILQPSGISDGSRVRTAAKGA